MAAPSTAPAVLRTNKLPPCDLHSHWGNAAATVSADEVKVIKSKLTANGG